MGALCGRTKRSGVGQASRTLLDFVLEARGPGIDPEAGFGEKRSHSAVWAGQIVWEGMGSWAGPVAEAPGRGLRLWSVRSGLGGRTVAEWAGSELGRKQDHEGEVRVQAGCVDGGSHVGRVGLRMGLCYSGESRRLQLSGVLGGATDCGRGSEVRWAACPPALWADHQARLGAHLELLGTS